MHSIELTSSEIIAIRVAISLDKSKLIKLVKELNTIKSESSDDKAIEHYTNLINNIESEISEYEKIYKKLI